MSSHLWPIWKYIDSSVVLKRFSFQVQSTWVHQNSRYSLVAIPRSFSRIHSLMQLYSKLFPEHMCMIFKLRKIFTFLASRGTFWFAKNRVSRPAALCSSKSSQMNVQARQAFVGLSARQLRQNSSNALKLKQFGAKTIFRKVVSNGCLENVHAFTDLPDKTRRSSCFVYRKFCSLWNFECHNHALLHLKLFSFNISIHICRETNKTYRSARKCHWHMCGAHARL